MVDEVQKFPGARGVFARGSCRPLLLAAFFVCFAMKNRVVLLNTPILTVFGSFSYHPIALDHARELQRTIALARLAGVEDIADDMSACDVRNEIDRARKWSDQEMRAARRRAAGPSSPSPLGDDRMAGLGARSPETGQLPLILAELSKAATGIFAGSPAAKIGAHLDTAERWLAGEEQRT
jgi:hypothetical protein